MIKNKKILFSAVIILIIVFSGYLLNKYVFSFEARARKGSADCQKFINQNLLSLPGTSIKAPVISPWCKINWLGRASFLNTLEGQKIKAGDLIIRTLNLPYYFGDQNDLFMELDADVVKNSIILKYIADKKIPIIGNQISLKKPFRQFSLCFDVQPGFTAGKWFLAPWDLYEESIMTTNRQYICTKLINPRQMPVLSFAFLTPANFNQFKMTLYLPPEDLENKKIRINDFIDFHDYFLPFNKSIINF